MGINQKYENIAKEYQVSGENQAKILNGMGLTEVSKNPSNDKLETFSAICQLIKDGTPQEEAIAKIMNEREPADAETSKEKSNSSLTSVESMGKQIGREAGKQIKEVFIPKLQQHGLKQVVEGFQVGLTEELKGVFDDINFSQMFQDFSEIDIEDIQQGKLESTSNNVALPQGSSELSPEP